MKFLVRIWPQLDFGESAGDPCSCERGLCVDGGCKGFFPTSFAKDVFSLGELCDRLLCEMILLYKTTGGSVVAGHLNACVTGHCPECEQSKDDSSISLAIRRVVRTRLATRTILKSER